VIRSGRQLCSTRIPVAFSGSAADPAPHVGTGGAAHDNQVLCADRSGAALRWAAALEPVQGSARTATRAAEHQPGPHPKRFALVHISRLCSTIARLCLVAACCAPACSPSAAPPEAPAATASSEPKLHEGPLLDYVPAAGLRWLVVGRPRDLVRDPGFAAALEPLLPEARLDAYAASTGVDLRALPSAAVAGFSLGTMYLAETLADNARAEELFALRVEGQPILERPHPRVARMLGVVDGEPQALVSIRGQLLALAVRDPTLARIVEAFAREQLRESPPALEGAALSTLPTRLDRSPIRFYAPGPFDGEWSTGARGLLSIATALAVTADPVDPGKLRATVILAGDWGKPIENATVRLSEAWEDLAGSPTGRLLGLNRPAVPPRVSAPADTLELVVELELAPIVAGLRAAVMADVWEILDLPPPGRQRTESPENAQPTENASDFH
jgi:hypothetical protein